MRRKTTKRAGLMKTVELFFSTVLFVAFGCVATGR
jgi:hypothetical protein